MPNTLEDRAVRAIELAQKAGAAGVWADASRSRGLTVDLRDGEVEKVQENVSRSLSLRLWVEGRYSTHATTDLDPDRLSDFVEQAVALTRALEPDADRVMPDPELFAGRTDANLELVDPSLAGRTLEERVAQCQAMNARTQGQKDVISATSSAYDGHYRSAMASSNGFSGAYEATWAGLNTFVTLQGEGDKRPEDGLGATARFAADLLGPREVGDRALARARARLGTKKGPTLKGTMVVDPQAGGRLVGSLLGPANGWSVQQGRSFWAGRVGKRSVSEKLTIRDEPLLARGLGSRPFDSEGIAAHPLPIIDRGKLQNFYIDTYYGKKLGMAPTTGSPSNRIIKPGRRDLATIVSGLKKGVYVTSWLGGNSDSNTGDFSFGMRGHLIENGEIGAPVGEMNVTGNLLDLFSDLDEVGNDPWPYSSMKVPTLVFRDVDFSGV